MNTGPQFSIAFLFLFYTKVVTMLMTQSRVCCAVLTISTAVFCSAECEPYYQGHSLLRHIASD